VIGNNKASGGASTLVLNNGTTPAPIRKFHVHVYFVAPCSFGTGTNGVCQASDDSIPTLKRLELVAESGTTMMKLVPLVEGIEYLKLEYGIDSLPNAADPATGLMGDATIDAWNPDTATIAWTTVIAAKVYVLARNTEPTAGFTDDKTYTLGTVTVTPADYALYTRYKRHVYTVVAHLMNPAGRREIP
jgi:type IV pilus assembly protein PilW